MSREPVVQIIINNGKVDEDDQETIHPAIRALGQLASGTYTSSADFDKQPPLESLRLAEKAMTEMRMAIKMNVGIEEVVESAVNIVAYVTASTHRYIMDREKGAKK